MRLKTPYPLQQGFTIIELLVVIVVIGILASITIVSYSGITTRANTISAQNTASTVAQKAEIYNAEIGRYPYQTSDLTTDITKSYYVSSNTVSFTLSTTQPANPNTLKFIKCGTIPNTNQSDIISANNNLTGIRIYYWTYTGTPNADAYVTAGANTGGTIACPTT